MSVSIVVQRFRQCKLLIDEESYVTIDGGEDTNSCGILAYVSFASSTTHSQVKNAAETLLNLPVLTTGLWGDGNSSTRSILQLSAEKESSSSLVIVPQANLTSKVKQQGKSIQYHGQINKEEGQILYNHFCDCLKGRLLEEQCLSSSKDLPSWYQKRKALLNQQHENDNNKQTAYSPSTPPNELFRDSSKYSEWNEHNGFPLKDVEGNAISKSQSKKLKKQYDAHCKRYDKFMKNGNGEANEAVAEMYPTSNNDEVPKFDDNALDPSFCQFLAGSFGKRQGLEFSSDMGPFVHSFQV